MQSVQEENFITYVPKKFKVIHYRTKAHQLITVNTLHASLFLQVFVSYGLMVTACLFIIKNITDHSKHSNSTLQDQWQ